MTNETLLIESLDAVPAAAAAVVRAMRRAATGIVTFDGEMGAGKTTLIRSIVRALGADGCADANSPSFAIANDYGRADDGRNVFHFDLYRLESAAEAMDIGFEDYIDDPANVCLIEWPDRAEELLPSDILRLRLDLLPDLTRRLTITLP